MKNYKLFIPILLIVFFFFGCDDEISNQMSGDLPQDYDIEYEIRQVMQYDPMNINGIDISKKLDFFSTVRFTLHYNGGKITSLSYSNGEVPFSPFGFGTDLQTETECELDYDVMPNELRIKGTDNVVAYFQNGEFIMPFRLDCGTLSYKYTFANID
ncbi:MAG: hypothetical protein ACK5M7_06500 [Draconibacterium sp.]